MSEHCWFKNGLRFKCLAPGCNKCCGEGGFVRVEAELLDKMAKHLGLTTDGFVLTYLHCKDGQFFARMDAKTGRCPFVTEQGCSIYEHRPRQCRTFPWWPPYLESERGWEEAFKRCPGVGVGPVHTADEIRREMMG